MEFEWDPDKAQENVAKHGVSFADPLLDQSLYDEISIRVRMNGFLLALWLARRTRTYLARRFEEVEGGESVAARMLDRFQWIEGHVSEDMHGRTHNRRHAESNLRDLAAMSDALRALWNRILEADDLPAALDADDQSREALFKRL